MRAMPPRQLLDWMFYFELEPFGEERADLRVSFLLQKLEDLDRKRDASRRRHNRMWTPSKLKDHVLRIGDLLPPAAPRTQTPQDHKHIMRAIAMAYAPGVRAADNT